jgi:hypothetical protein
MQLDALPGFRRRIRITPLPGAVRSEVEDDYHCMRVTVQHDGVHAIRLDVLMDRVPWTTCPGAAERLQQTFTGVALTAFAARGEKRDNCTHLHDLAVLAAAHAADSQATVFDILVSDAIDGKRRVELRRNSVTELSWIDSAGIVVEPAEMAGLALEKLRPWIESLEPGRREGARLLQWGAILANGRNYAVHKQSDASTLAVGRCYTFQPQRVKEARRMATIRDFSNGTAQPLEGVL